MSSLILKRASASRRSGEWSDDDYDVLADGVVVGRIMKAAAKPANASRLCDRATNTVVEHPRQIVERLVAAFVKYPVSDGLPDRLERFAADRRTERYAEFTAIMRTVRRYGATREAAMAVFKKNWRRE